MRRAILLVLLCLFVLAAAAPAVVSAGYYCEKAKESAPFTTAWYLGWASCLAELIALHEEQWL